MIFVTDSKVSDWPSPKIKAFLNDAQMAELTNTVLGYGSTVDDFFERKTSCLVVNESNWAIPCELINAAGLRLSPFLNSVTNQSVSNPLFWRQLKLAALAIKADFVQVLLPPSLVHKCNRSIDIIIENYLFEITPQTINGIPSDVADSDYQLAPIDFNRKSDAIRMAEIELSTRFQFPSSTYAPKDSFEIVQTDYLSFKHDSEINGLCIDGDIRNGFIIWQSNSKTKKAIVIHIWIPPQQRHRNIGTLLLKSMLKKLSSEDIYSCRYFVAASNLNAISMLVKNKFRMKSLVLEMRYGQ